MSVLLYGFGNPGRQDDGLGPLVIEEIEGRNIPGVTIDVNYQLQIEDAAEMAKHEVVIFVDASVKGTGPFTVQKVKPERSIGYTSHAVGPQSILAICKDVFGKVPETWIIGIRGYEFEFGEGISKRAKTNFDKALEFIIILLSEYKGRKMAEKNVDKKTILIIDDDADLRASMRIVLEASGFSIGEAADGEEGTKIAERIKPDAIIVDLMMETIDAGSKLSTYFKEKGFDCPIFLLSSAGDTVRYNIDARELGLAGIFQKPIDHKVLINTLKKQLKIE